MTLQGVRPRTNEELEAPPISAPEQIGLIETHLASRGLTVLDLAKANMPADGPMEVWDAVTQALWFFHSHPDQPRFPGEAGHFHTFLGATGMPRGVEPFVLPEMAMAPVARVEETGHPVTHLSSRHRGRFGHIIGVSVDGSGMPIGFFTTNRWVTGELWYRASDAARMIDNFQLANPVTIWSQTGADPGLAAVSTWLRGVLTAFRPHIEALLLERDAIVMDWRRRRSRQHHVFEDRRLEVPSSKAIAFQSEVASLRNSILNCR